MAHNHRKIKSMKKNEENLQLLLRVEFVSG